MIFISYFKAWGQHNLIHIFCDKIKQNVFCITVCSSVLLYKILLVNCCSTILIVIAFFLTFRAFIFTLNFGVTLKNVYMWVCVCVYVCWHFRVKVSLKSCVNENLLKFKCQFKIINDRCSKKYWYGKKLTWSLFLLMHRVMKIRMGKAITDQPTDKENRFNTSIHALILRTVISLFMVKIFLLKYGAIIISKSNYHY